MKRAGLEKRLGQVQVPGVAAKRGGVQEQGEEIKFVVRRVVGYFESQDK
jgi:hypothetical protein